MRHGDPVSRWVPVNPNHAAEVIHAALQNRSVGTPRESLLKHSPNPIGLIWVADAHRDDGKRLVVHADEKLTAFVELESVIRSCDELPLLRHS
jgi:hypothetical protein